MDRQTDLTLEALIAREGDSREGLDHFHQSRIEKDGFAFFGIHRRNEIVDRIFQTMKIVEPPKETKETLESFETYQTWLKSFGYPHPAHVKIDPYSFMWADGINCDRCGAFITPLNKPNPSYGICFNCTLEMNEDQKNGEWDDD